MPFPVSQFALNDDRGILSKLPGPTKILAKIILEWIKEHLESLIDREEAYFGSGSSYIDHINNLRFTLRGA